MLVRVDLSDARAIRGPWPIRERVLLCKISDFCQ